MIACLVIAVLEPLKQYVIRFLRSLLTTGYSIPCIRCLVASCVETHAGIRQDSGEDFVRGEYANPDKASEGGAKLPGVGPASGAQYVTPTRPMKQVIVLLSILYCFVIIGRIGYVVAKILFNSSMMIIANLDSYKLGAAKVTESLHDMVKSLNVESLDWEWFVEKFLEILRQGATLITENIMGIMGQAVVVFIFLIFLMWSPIKADRKGNMETVMVTTQQYLKIKVLTSTFVGLCVGLSLWIIGYDIPGAFGLVAMFVNFLPNVGAVISTVLTTSLGIIDARLTYQQVTVAFVVQCIIHLISGSIIEPTLFSRNTDVHPVIILFGISFFGYAWGLAGVILAVPLIAILRLFVSAWVSEELAKKKTKNGGGGDRQLLRNVDAILSGRVFEEPLYLQEKEEQEAAGDFLHSMGETL